MKNSKHRFDRRTFLKAAGLGAGAFFLPSLARGDSNALKPPRRIIFMMSELGWNPFEFRMKPPGAPDEVLLRSAYHPSYKDQPDPLTWELDLKRTPREDFSHALEPLYDLREHALVLDGLGMLSIGLDGLGDAHAKGWNHALSGYPATGFITGQRSMGGRPSLDMQISKHLRAQNPNLTDLTALHFYINHAWWGGGVDTFHHFFYDEGPNGEIVKVPTESNPKSVFDKLFPGGMLGGESLDSVAESKILEELEAGYGEMRPNLSTRDKQKLDLHQQTVSDIKNRIDTLRNLECNVPATPTNPRDLSLPDSDAFEMNLEAFFELTTVALSCGLTRVVSMQLPNSSGVRSSFYGAGDHDFHEWYSHGTNPPKRWRGVENANVTEEEHNKFLDASPIIANKNRFHVELAARLARKLQQVPDGEGTLLDSTLIVLMDEISHGSHGHDQWPVVMLGGFGGAFRTGRYIRFPRTNPSPSFNSSGSYAGVPHNHLLVSIAQAMGMPIDDMGVQSVYARRGGYAGQNISLAGPLSQLY
jgi:hypothetical protein